MFKRYDQKQQFLLPLNLNLTEFINLHSVFLQKTHRIGIEYFGKMKISKIKEHSTDSTSPTGSRNHLGIVKK